MHESDEADHIDRKGRQRQRVLPNRHFHLFVLFESLQRPSLGDGKPYFVATPSMNAAKDTLVPGDAVK